MRIWQIIFILWGLVASTGLRAAPLGEAVQGELDLRDWSLDKDGIISLSGSWEFYWQQLLTPDDILNGESSRPEHININRGWNRNDHPRAAMDGYGTYRLRVKLPPGSRQLILRSSIFWSSSRIFINGREISRSGRPAATRSGYEFGIRRSETPFPVEGGDLEILVQVANYDMFLLGNHGRIFLGEAGAMAEYSRKKLAESVFLFASLFMMGIYNIFLFLMRREDRPALWFGVSCMLAAGYGALVGGGAVYVLLPELSGSAFMRCVSVCWYGGALAFIHYARHLYPDFFGKGMHRLLMLPGVLLWLHVLVAPMRHYLFLSPVFQLLVVAAIIVLIRTGIRVIRSGDKGGWIFILAFGIAGAGVINDMLFTTGQIHSEFVGHWALVLFTLGQSLLVSIRHAHMYEQAGQKLVIEKHLATAQTVYGTPGSGSGGVPGATWAVHYQPAEVTSGDWFGIWHDEQNDRLYAMIGDVSGHGIVPSLMTVAASGAMNSARSVLLRSGPGQGDRAESLRILATAMNSALRSSSTGFGLHMTMAFVAIDLQDGKGSYLNAGHGPLYLLAENQQPGALLRGGTPLGIAEHPRFGEREFRLAKGQCLLLYTDGLTENTGPGDRVLNLRRILTKSCRQTGDPLRVREEVLSQGRAVWQGRPPDDDCLVATLVRHDRDGPVTA